MGNHTHGQMLTNEELDVVSVLIGDLKISTHLPNNLRADFAVVPASAFTDVVVEKSKNQTPASLHCHHEFGTERQLVGVFTVCEVSEITNCKECVLIDRVSMEQIMLHLTHDSVERRQQFSEHTPAVHFFQSVPDASASLDNLQECLTIDRIFSPFFVHQRMSFK